MSGATGGNTYKQGAAPIYNGNGSLEDSDSTSGCNPGPITGYDLELAFIPLSGPGHPFPYTDFTLSAVYPSCKAGEEADLYWSNLGT
jgi:hypothetical protein